MLEVGRYQIFLKDEFFEADIFNKLFKLSWSVTLASHLKSLIYFISNSNDSEYKLKVHFKSTKIHFISPWNSWN